MKTLFLSLSFLFSTLLSAQSWQPLADFPGLALDDAASFSIGDHGYIVTGFQTGFTPANTGFRYHAYTDTWETIPALPGLARQYSAGASANGKGYILGGINGTEYLKDVWEYDPVNDSWLLMDSLPFPGLSSAVALTIDNKIYIGTGVTAGNHFTSEWWELDPLTNTWTQKMNFPGPPRKVAAGFSIDGKGYILTGIDSAFTMYNDVWEYDPIANTWTQKNNFPGTPRFYAKSIVPGNAGTQAYLLMGWDSTGEYANDVWLYDSSSDSWTEQDTLPSFGRKGISTFTVNNEIFFSTGIDQSGNRLNQTWGFGQTIGIPENNNELLKIYPNPSLGQVTIDVPFSADALIITDVWGRVVFQQAGPVTTFTWQAGSPGLFIIRVLYKEHWMYKKVLIKT